MLLWFVGRWLLSFQSLVHRIESSKLPSGRCYLEEQPAELQDVPVDGWAFDRGHVLELEIFLSLVTIVSNCNLEGH